MLQYSKGTWVSTRPHWTPLLFSHGMCTSVTMGRYSKAPDMTIILPAPGTSLPSSPGLPTLSFSELVQDHPHVGNLRMRGQLKMTCQTPAGCSTFRPHTNATPADMRALQTAKSSRLRGAYTNRYVGGITPQEAPLSLCR